MAGCGGARPAPPPVGTGPGAGLGATDDDLRASAIAGAWQQVAAVAARRKGAGLLIGGSRPTASGAAAVAVDRDGTPLWTATGPAPAAVSTLATAPDDGVIAGGRFSGSLGPLQGDGDAGGFVVRLTADGAEAWSAALSSAGYAHVRAVAPTEDGGAVAAGYFRRDVAVAGARPVRSAGSHDGFVVRFGPDGDVQWLRGLGGPGPDYAHAIALAGDGDVVVAGSFAGKVDLGDQEHQSINNSSDGFVARLAAADGATRWSARHGSAFDDAAFGVGVGDGGAVLVAGTFGGTGLLGGPPVESRGGDDVFVVAFDADGGMRWQQTLGSGGDDDVVGLVTLGSTAVVAGSFPAPLYLGPSSTPRLTPAGGRDVFLAALNLSDGSVADARHFGGTGLDAVASIAATDTGVAAVGSLAGGLDVSGTPAPGDGDTPFVLTWQVP